MINKDNIAWFDAPLPRRWHRCRAQSSGTVGALKVDRCACGAIRFNKGFWMDRNERRKSGER